MDVELAGLVDVTVHRPADLVVHAAGVVLHPGKVAGDA
jgi:hypothetical protein